MSKNLKLIIKSINERQKSINNLVGEISKYWGDEQRVLKLFIEAPQYSLSHPKVISLLADFLQCINDESLLSEFDLRNVEDLYRLNLEVLKFELSQYEDLSHFYFSVLDDETKASEILKKGEEKARSVLDSLKEIRQSLR